MNLLQVVLCLSFFALVGIAISPTFKHRIPYVAINVDAIFAILTKLNWQIF